jgi:hypothetical protein
MPRVANRTANEGRITQEGGMAECVKRIEDRDELVHRKAHPHERHDSRQPDRPAPPAALRKKEAYETHDQQCDRSVANKPTQVGRRQRQALLAQE